MKRTLKLITEFDSGQTGMGIARRGRSWSRVALQLQAALLVWLCLQLPGHGARSGRPDEACAQTKPLPPPSYDSYFWHQTALRAESSLWSVKLARWARSAECAERFSFRVENRRSGKVSHFTLCNITEQVDEIDLVAPSRALILGRLGASYPVANLVELPSGKVIDHFMCFMPVVSPNHRFLAFIKGFPGHPGPVAVAAEYIVYDLTRSSAYNRPQFKPGIHYDAGWPVYPPAATNAAQENLRPPGSPVHQWSSQRLSWLASDKLAFTDYFRGADRLVVVDLGHGLKHPDVRTVRLEPSQIIDLKRCKEVSAPSDYRRWARYPAGLIQVDQISLSPTRPAWVCLHFYFSGRACLARTRLAIPLPRSGLPRVATTSHFMSSPLPREASRHSIHRQN